MTDTRSLTNVSTSTDDVFTQLGAELKISGLPQNLVMSGNGRILAIIGGTIENPTPDENINRDRLPIVRVYRYDPDQGWSQLGLDFVGDGGAFHIPGDMPYIGDVLSMSSDGLTLAIGGKYFSGEGRKYYVGRVVVYRYMNEKWTKLGDVMRGHDEFVDFGSDIALSKNGNILAVGVPNANDKAQHSGHLKVFEYKNTIWSQIGKTILGLNVEEGHFGGELTLSSNGRIVTSSTHDQNHKIRSFKFVNERWVKYGRTIKVETNHYLPILSLSSKGNRLLVGSGMVHTYKKKKENWVQIGVDLQTDVNGDNSGSMSLSNDGNTLVVTSSNILTLFFRNMKSGWTQIGAEIEGEGDGLVSTISGNGRVLGIIEQFQSDRYSSFSNPNPTLLSNTRLYTFPNQCVPPGSNCFKPDSKTECDDSDCQSKVCNANSSCCTNWSPMCKSKASELCRPCACKEEKKGLFFIATNSSNPGDVRSENCKWLKKQTAAKQMTICSTFSGTGSTKAARFVCPKSCRLKYCK